MLEVLASWLVIAVAAYIFGRAVVDTLYRRDAGALAGTDVYLVSGMVVLSIYAQLFSLLYKVAGIACTVLGAAGIGTAAVFWVRRRRRRERIWTPVWGKRHPYRTALLILCILVTALWTVPSPGHYDTGLYHAQAIRWVEEYGVVPGLGNLHMRFAYNSAFMCLQALFSLSWLLGDSLHTLNGFCCALCLGYAVSTAHVRGAQAWRTSDFLKCASVIYIVLVRWDISSPCTDIWAMLLVLYLCTKWCEFEEKQTEGTAPWCWLCLLGFYALTLKLSAAVIVFLTIWPFQALVRGRKMGELLQNIAAAVMIVGPFLLRNVIISGYLVYPYAKLDLFAVDWKMDRLVAADDSLLIKVFGRGFTDPEEYYHTPFLQWIVRWFGRQETGDKLLILAGVLGACVVLVRLFGYIRTGRAREAVFAATVLICLGFWMATAPLMRYGAAWLLIAAAVAAGSVRFPVQKVRIGRPVCLILAALALGGIYVPDLRNMPDRQPIRLIKQAGYPTWPQTAHPFGGQEKLSVWTPDEGDLGGYYYFPSTPQEDQLAHLGLRGDGFEDGFRYLPDTDE